MLKNIQRRKVDKNKILRKFSKTLKKIISHYLLTLLQQARGQNGMRILSLLTTHKELNLIKFNAKNNNFMHRECM